MSGAKIFNDSPAQLSRPSRPSAKPLEEVIAEFDARHAQRALRVIVAGTDMPFGEMVKTAFMWLLAITIASIPFDLVAIVIYSLAS